MPLTSSARRTIAVAVTVAAAAVALRAVPRRAAAPGFAASLHPVALTYEARLADSLVGIHEVRLRADGEIWERRELFRTPTLRHWREDRFRADLSPVSHRAVVDVGDDRGRLELTWAAGRVRGWMRGSPALGGDRRIDRVAPQGVLLAGTEPWLLAASPLAVGRELTIASADPFSGGVRTLRARISAAETIEVPAGRFAALRVDLDGGARLWLRRDPPHLTLRAAYPGKPILELASLR